MQTLREMLHDHADKHEERMRTDPRYAMIYRIMQESTTTVERSRHYDRDGYCDNPARGY